MGLTRVFLAIPHNSALASSPASGESTPVILCACADSACPSMSLNAEVAGPSQYSCSGLMCESPFHSASNHCLTTLDFPLFPTSGFGVCYENACCFYVLHMSCLLTTLRPRERSLSLRQHSPVASLVLRKSPVLWANICQAAGDFEQPQHLSSIAQGSTRSTRPVGDKATHSSHPHDTIVYL